jgi:hypothetical protein
MTESRKICPHGVDVSSTCVRTLVKDARGGTLEIIDSVQKQSCWLCLEAALGRWRLLRADDAARKRKGRFQCQ